MVDRIDIFIEVPKVKTDKFTQSGEQVSTDTSQIVKERVEKARSIQQNRFKNSKITSNSEMTSKELKEFCTLDEETNTIMKRAVDSMNLSARSYYRILKLARTIADLELSEQIQMKHVLEALSYRKKD
jgi:magnesium chelatase family protein